jgi:hypothetical protein
MGETTRPDSTYAELLTEVDAALGSEDEYPLSELPKRVAALRAELVATRQALGAFVVYTDRGWKFNDDWLPGALRLAAQLLAPSPEQETRE